MNINCWNTKLMIFFIVNGVFFERIVIFSLLRDLKLELKFNLHFPIDFSHFNSFILFIGLVGIGMKNVYKIFMDRVLF